MSDNNSTSIQPTPVQEWRRRQREGEAIIVPSGLEIRVRRYSLLDLFTNSLVPKELEDQLLEVIQNPNPAVILANFAKFSPLIDLTLGHAIIDPPLATEPDDDHLSLGELTTMDKMSLFNWVNSIKV